MFIRLKWIISGGCAIVLLIVGCFIYLHSQTADPTLQASLLTPSKSKDASPEKKSPSIQSSTHSKNTQNAIMVDLKGQIKHPGVYRFKLNQRVQDAIQKAGGFTEKANQTSINLAQKLRDEMVIYVPKKGETSPIVSTSGIQSGTQSGTNDQTPTVHLNSATLDQLQELPGVGPSKAQAILKYREDHGSFKTVEDLLNVTGIGEKSLEKMKDQIELN